MKNILFYASFISVLFAFSLSSCRNICMTDMEYYGLHGDVKQVLYTLGDNYWVKYEYNKEGNITSIKAEDEHQVYTYENGLLSKAEVMKNGKVVYSVSYDYDNDGYVSRCSSVDKTSEKTKEINYFYIRQKNTINVFKQAHEGQLKQQLSIDINSDGTLHVNNQFNIHAASFTVDKRGHLLSVDNGDDVYEISRNSNGSFSEAVSYDVDEFYFIYPDRKREAMIPYYMYINRHTIETGEERLKYTYEYDENGNWTKCYVSFDDNDTFVWNQTVTYRQ